MGQGLGGDKRRKNRAVGQLQWLAAVPGPGDASQGLLYVSLQSRVEQSWTEASPTRAVQGDPSTQAWGFNPCCSDFSLTFAQHSNGLGSSKGFGKASPSSSWLKLQAHPLLGGGSS